MARYVVIGELYHINLRSMKALLWLLGIIIGGTIILAKGYKSPRQLSKSLQPYNDSIMLVDSHIISAVNHTTIQTALPEDDHSRFKLIVLDN